MANKPTQAQQIAINADRLSPEQREIENQIQEEKRRWTWFDSLCVASLQTKR